jgi:hypoxanthine-DNA glycosylase
MTQTHPIPPIYNENSKILILGSFPSVKSREQQFFYGHKQNRFWKVLAQILECPIPNDIEEKKKMLLNNNIALWDVIASCSITGSSDASITDVVPNDLSPILTTADIQAIYCNGNKAYELYQKYIYPTNKIKAIKLPSTSPANASYSLERLVGAWKKNMSIETFEDKASRLKMYQDLLISEQQIKEGKVKDAKESLIRMSEKIR